MLVLIGIYYHYNPQGFKLFPGLRQSYSLQRQRHIKSIVYYVWRKNRR